MSLARGESISGIQRPLFSMTEAPGLPALVERKGAVYTKPWVVDLILDLAGYLETENLVDKVAIEPSVGDGAFLGMMIQRLIRSCNRLGRPYSDCRSSLIGFELDAKSAGSARSLAETVLTENGVIPSLAEELASHWVRTGDYLLDSLDIQADFVIGNPPYVRLEEIPEHTCAVYRDLYRTMRGRADLYVGFFEAALRQLKHDGVCSFICADRWMRNQYGSELRRLITSKFAVEAVMEMHDAAAFEDEVDAYPAITVLRRRRQGKTIVASIRDVTKSEIHIEAMRAILRQVSAGEQLVSGETQIEMVNSWFEGSEPWACNSPAQLNLLRKIENSFEPLESSAKVGIGVATGSDRIFITKDPDIVESSRLLKLALARDLSSGSMEWSGHYLIDPWDDKGVVDLERFPRLKSYFDSHARDLRGRHVGQNNRDAWFRTIDRVSHELTGRQKLYIADIKERLLPVLDSGETYPHHNLYYVESESWDMEVLGAILMSSVAQFFIESYAVRMRGGYLRFQAQYLRRIRVPAPNSIPFDIAELLRNAFRSRDIKAASILALDLYGIDPQEMERAFEH